ncbi:MAG: YbaL family putative K(+) efflux transporter [Hyphomonadaceae bacterium]
MPHGTPLITLMSVGLGLAFVFGMIATRLRLSPLVGYLIAGVVIGPFTPGYIADAHLASELAEMGVILLMFGVGLHFSLDDLMSVRKIALPGAVAQIAVATLLGLGMGVMMGWTVEAGIVFGLALSVASTVVLLRALQERHVMHTKKGKIAVGWLIVEDLAMVLALVLLPTWADLRGQMAASGGGFTWDQALQIGWAVLLTFGKVGAFAVIMLVAGKRIIPWLLHRVVHVGSRELFRLAVLAIALGVALGASELFGVSFALGAFFAGMIMGESELSHQAANETLPLRDAFAVLFFVSVGMLFDPMTVVNAPLPLLGAVAIVIVGKSLAALLIMHLFRQPRESSALIAASLAQIGEFSFILASLGLGLGLLPGEASDLILGAAIISIVLNPFAFMIVDRLTPKPAKAVDAEIMVKERAIIVGFGRVGSRVARSLGRMRIEYSVVEDRQDVVERLHGQGVPAIAGNAVAADVLKAAAVEQAQLIYVTVPDGFEAGRIVEIARQLNPKIRILARSHNDAEIDYLTSRGADVIISGEEEIAQAMIEATQTAVAVPAAAGH